MEYKIIAIEREYASGGSAVGQKLAEKLGILCYDEEILEQAAAFLQKPVQSLREVEESITGSLLFGLNMLANVTSGKRPGLTTTQELALVEANIIAELAMNPCVLVGRGAAGLLKSNPKVLRVFISADHSKRLERAVKVYGIDSGEAESTLRTFDKRRANYFKVVTGLEWKNSDNYHIMLNSAKLGINTVTDILYQVVKAKD